MNKLLKDKILSIPFLIKGNKPLKEILRRWKKMERRVMRKKRSKRSLKLRRPFDL